MNVYIFKNTFDCSFIDIKSGDWVVLKPNLIKECKANFPDEWEHVITSRQVIESVCEYVCQRLSGKGKISICDAPQTDSSFVKIAERLGLFDLATTYKQKYGIPIEIIDLRNEEWENEQEIITQRRKLRGDPNGSIVFNLGRDSLFYGYHGEGRYYGADYDTQVVNQHHCGETQEYLIAATPIMADVFINLPKLKTHKKTGVTLSLKNLVGINADKNWLPHHTEGSPQNGGDQFPDQHLKHSVEQYAVKFVRNLALNVPYLGPAISKRLRRYGKKVFGDTSQVIRSGNWYGNDTTWRMTLDLNRCLLYGNPDGTLRQHDPKRYYTVIDGIVGMEGNGPVDGDPVHSGVIIAGTDPVATDMVAARVMGFDWRKIPVIREALQLVSLPLAPIKPEDILVVSDQAEWNGHFVDIERQDFYHFKPHFGWQGHLEYEL